MKSYYEAFQNLVKQGVHPETLVACVYGLYRDHKINESEKFELYDLVDPDKQYNTPFQFWCQLNEGSEPAWRYIASVASKTNIG